MAFGKINRRQKAVMWGIIVLIILTILFPPFVLKASNRAGSVERFMGYDSVFSSRFRNPATIDYQFLFTQFAAILVVGILLTIIFRSEVK